MAGSASNSGLDLNSMDEEKKEGGNTNSGNCAYNVREVSEAGKKGKILAKSSQSRGLKCDLPCEEANLGALI